MQGEDIVMLSRDDLVADLHDQIVALVIEPLAGIFGTGAAFFRLT